MKKTRAPDLTEDLIAVVVELLDGWKGKLTWGALINEMASKSGITYSRFTLFEHPRIAHAFELRKTALRGRPTGKRIPKDELVKAALERADRFQAKAYRLDAENRLLLEQFWTWSVNAERKGVTIAMLNAELPKPFRNQTKDKG